MKIPSVVQDMIQTEDGKVFPLDSAEGAAWLETIGSFRFEPTGDSKACTVRKEPSGYWYGCRKIAGTVRKKYIGKTSEISSAKLDEIAVDLENSLPPVSRSKKVAEVAEEVAQVEQVAEQVAQVEQDRLATLESQMAMVLQAVKDLQDALPGKSDAGDSVELPEVDNEVVERLQNELGNLKAENETLRRSLEKSDTLINLRNQEIAALNSRLAAKDETIAEASEQCDEFEKWWQEEKKGVADRDKIIADLRSELSDLKQKSTTARDLPDAFDFLNQIKAELPKLKLTHTDAKKILGIIEESW